MIIEFRCHADGKLLANLDDSCVRVQVKCERCGQIREYAAAVQKRFDYARVPVPVDRRRERVI